MSVIGLLREHGEGLFIGVWAALRNRRKVQGLVCLPHSHLSSAGFQVLMTAEHSRV